jgi:RNA polymerase sigma-70 factor, ECF subfamily
VESPFFWPVFGVIVLAIIWASSRERIEKQKTLQRLLERKLDFASELDTDEIPAQAQSLNANLDLVEALAELPHGARLCVVLAYHDGYTHDEIAEVTGLPVGTVKSHIVRGTARLRSRLDSYQGKT